MKEVGTLVGDTLHTMRRRNAIGKLTVDFKRADLLIEDVYKAASECISECVLHLRFIEVWLILDVAETCTIVSYSNHINGFKTQQVPRKLTEIPPKTRGSFFTLVNAKTAFELPNAPSILVVPFKDDGANVGVVRVGPRVGSQFALVATRVKRRVSTDDGAFITAVAAEVELACKYIRGREQRDEARRQSLEKSRRVCNQVTTLCRHSVLKFYVTLYVSTELITK